MKTSWRRPVHAVRGLFIRPHEDVRFSLTIWGSLALISLVAAVVFGQYGCFLQVREWVVHWSRGLNVYEGTLGVDYPPNALVFLSPLLLFPVPHGELWFASLNTIICVMAAWSIVSLTSGYAGLTFTRVERLIYVLMLLAWSPTRVAIWSGQTSPLLILACCLALRTSEWSPVLAGLLLGFGASKPHLAFGFVLMAAFCRMWKVLIFAALSSVGAAVLYAVSVHQSPFAVLWQYLTTLFTVYGGPTFYRGDVDLRPFFVDLSPTYAIGERLYLATTAITGLILLGLTWRSRARIEASVWVLAASLAWVTAFLPINRYGLLLIAPTVLLTLWRPPMKVWPLDVVAVVIAVIVADPPMLVRHGALDHLPHVIAQFAPFTHYIDRILIGACVAISYSGLARAGASPNA